MRALPASFRTEAETAAAAVIIDPSGWGGERVEQPPIVRELQTAVVQRRRVRFVYRAWDRAPAERLADPLGLIDKGSTWYFLAEVSGTRRTFRVDRMSEVEVTGEASTAPEGFDLGAAWDEVVREVDERRERAAAVLIIDAEIAPFLREALGQGGVMEDEDVEEPDPHFARIRVEAPTETLLARRLMGWGEFITVLEPPSLQVELARIAGAVARRNAGGDP